MNNTLSLFPKCEPYNTGVLKAGKHKIYYEECGNPYGKPAVFLHGGPGGGGSTQVRRFFSILTSIELLYLIKEDVVGVLHMDVLKITPPGILLVISSH